MRKLFFLSGFVLMGAITTLNVSADRMAWSFGSSAPQIVELERIDQLCELFEKHDYDVQKLRDDQGSVPRIQVASLPADIKQASHEKKDTFVQIMLPLILEVNQSVLKDRQRLLSMKKHLASGGYLKPYEQEWIMGLAEKYRAQSHSIDDILVHVDVIPPSLALAQASVESGWLTSVAARTKNSTFGHMATKKDVEAFESLYHNVEAYILNLNRHSAYGEFRKLRAEMRNSGGALCSVVLAKGLKRYSVRGHAYIRDIQKMIRQNEFTVFDQATLDS